jgi:NADH-quinone oxidoreductase subunit J
VSSALLLRRKEATMSETVSGIAFVVLALCTVGASVAMVASRNVVHAAYWLLGVCVAVAGLYFLLEADYIALVQLLIYAGALAILLIFTIMITLRSREDAVRSADFSPLGAVLAVAFFSVVAIAVVGWNAPVAHMPEQAPDLVDFGTLLFSPDGWAAQFEIASLVLTSALVAAVLWSKEGDK